MSSGWALLLSFLLLIGNGFFVAAEFALVASKTYRLERAVAEGRRGARAALDGTRELSLMLAGAQLGITLCTLGLGALAEPALAHVIDPVLHATGLPARTSYLIAFLISLAIVVFLHMVVGEMAPKSWAISHPESSAILLAPTFRGFTRIVRPVLAALNGTANGLLRLVRVRPQNQLAQAHGPEELALLLDQSREHGTIEATQHELLASILTLSERTVADVMQPIAELDTVPETAGADEIERRCQATGRSRLAVTDENQLIVGWVHVRDAVTTVTAGRTGTAGELMTPSLHLPAAADLIDTLASMREHRVQVALVGGARPAGFVALEDLLEEVIGDFDDETDRRAQ